MDWKFLNQDTGGLEIFESGYVCTGNFLIRIRVDWKFLNPDTCGQEIFESGEKNLRIQKYPDT